MCCQICPSLGPNQIWARMKVFSKEQKITFLNWILVSVTLESEKSLGPMFVNFGIFSRPYSLLKALLLLHFDFFPLATDIFKLYIHYFCQIFYALWLLEALHLIFLSNFPWPTSIPNSRVHLQSAVFWLLIQFLSIPKHISTSRWFWYCISLTWPKLTNVDHLRHGPNAR